VKKLGRIPPGGGWRANGRGTPRIQTAESVTTTSIRWSTTIPASPTQRSSVTRRADLCGFPPSRRRGLRPRRHRRIAEVMTDNARTTPSAPFPKRPRRGRRRPRPDPASLPLQNGGREAQPDSPGRVGLSPRLSPPTANGLVLWLRRYNTERPHSSLEDDRRSVGCHELMAKYT